MKLRLISSRDVVTKDIGMIRSKDSEGEKNSSLKQQLNSLLYLRKVIDHRIHRLQSEDTDSFGVPSQVTISVTKLGDFWNNFLDRNFITIVPKIFAWPWAILKATTF